MKNTTKESFKINGENLLKKIKELIKEGNVTKITIHDKSGKELMSFPLTVGVVGTVLAPVIAAIGALAAVVGECTITTERERVIFTSWRIFRGHSTQNDLVCFWLRVGFDSELFHIHF